MSIKEVTYYQVVCDWPGCGATAHDASDFSAWSDDGAAREEVEWANSDGAHAGVKWDESAEWYCSEHPTVWASDLIDDTAALGQAIAPEPPYLLIHDGDTDSDDDDGRVTLVGGA